MNQNNTFCGKCGNMLEAGSNYCTQCGALNTTIRHNVFSEYTNPMSSFSYNILYREKLNLNWPTIILAICGVILGVISIFVFWWLSLIGLSIEMKTLRDINKYKRKGKIISYIGISLCGAIILLYILVRVVS